MRKAYRKKPKCLHIVCQVWLSPSPATWQRLSTFFFGLTLASPLDDWRLRDSAVHVNGDLKLIQFS